MNDIVAVLVVPAEGDPGGLLAKGGLFSWPPVVTQLKVDWVPGRAKANALPLWWDGALVPEGWDRARRVWAEAPGRTPLSFPWVTDNVSLAQAETLAHDLVLTGRASRVVRLHRVDGRLVEAP